MQNKEIKKIASTRHSKNVSKVHQENLTFGERLADRLAEIAGSWLFIFIFFLLLLAWISLNTIATFVSFDKYPFILLNLILSCLAAIQAPIILMSQNREERRDRIRSEMDYKINLKAEILIEHLIQRLSLIEENQNKLEKLIQKQLNKNKLS